jgi:hypothetical protein
MGLLWFHAKLTCKLETNYKTTAQQEQEITDTVPKMVYMVGKVNTGMNSTQPPRVCKNSKDDGWWARFLPYLFVKEDQRNNCGDGCSLGESVK